MGRVPTAATPVASREYRRTVQRDEARALLGVTSDDPAVLRAAYRRRLRDVHPDVSGASDAAEATMQVTAAYHLLLTPAPPTRGRTAGAASRPGGRGRSRTAQGRPSASQGAPPTPRRREGPTVRANVVDTTTVAVEGTRAEALAAVLEAAHRLGEVGYLDTSAGLVEVIVEFVEAPTSSVVFTLQGRSHGVVDVFCSVEPLSGGESPPADAVTRLVAETLRAIPLADLPV